MKIQGILSVWIGSRGFGFITDANRTRYFAHHSRFVEGKPYVGATVEFDVCPEKEGMNPSAEHIELVAPEVGEVRQ
jgi:cold shock CspA family protein